MMNMANTQILPAVMLYAGKLAKSVNAVKEAGADASVQAAELKEIQKHLKEMKRALDALQREEKKAGAIEETRAQAFCYLNKVKPAMEKLRESADALEQLVDKRAWPFPTYADLMFSVE